MCEPRITFFFLTWNTIYFLHFTWIVIACFFPWTWRLFFNFPWCVKRRNIFAWFCYKKGYRGSSCKLLRSRCRVAPHLGNLQRYIFKHCEPIMQVAEKIAQCNKVFILFILCSLSPSPEWPTTCSPYPEYTQSATHNTLRLIMTRTSLYGWLLATEISLSV